MSALVLNPAFGARAGNLNAISGGDIRQTGEQQSSAPHLLRRYPKGEDVPAESESEPFGKAVSKRGFDIEERQASLRDRGSQRPILRIPRRETEEILNPNPNVRSPSHAAPRSRGLAVMKNCAGGPNGPPKSFLVVAPV